MQLCLPPPPCFSSDLMRQCAAAFNQQRIQNDASLITLLPKAIASAAVQPFQSASSQTHAQIAPSTPQLAYVRAAESLAGSPVAGSPVAGSPVAGSPNESDASRQVCVPDGSDKVEPAKPDASVANASVSGLDKSKRIVELLHATNAEMKIARSLAMKSAAKAKSQPMVMKKKAAVMKAMKAMKAKKIKVPMKAAAKKKNAKPKKWLKLRPHGCSKCRYIPGCTLSCWGGKPPK
jgi:hypothetical protein